jgi:uncharacterized protein (TIGR02757 family)
LARRAAPAGDPLAEGLEALRNELDDARYVAPDPLSLVRDLGPDGREGDREIAALVASSLALGGVGPAVARARDLLCRLDPRGEGLASALHRAILDDRSLRRLCAGWRHRFFDADDAYGLLRAAGRLRADEGSLGAAFLGFVGGDDADVGPALTRWIEALARRGAFKPNLVPSPANGSACKRPLLMLRWLVRRDNVDPGGWERVGAHRLVVPLDVHMTRIAKALGLLSRTTPDWKAALELTEAFRRFSPEDPVRYDFCLTRMGIAPTDACARVPALAEFCASTGRAGPSGSARARAR